MRLLLTGLLVSAAVLMARDALAINACTAAEIMSQESGCPAAGVVCSITNQYTISDGCSLDFSGHDVTLAPTASITIGSGKVTLLTNNLTLAAGTASGADINGRGTGSSAPTNQGGTFIVTASGDVTIQKAGFTRARIEVSATHQAGTIQINAGGTVSIAGRLEADQEPNASSAFGGMIVITAGQDIISQIGSQILAGSGAQSVNGGGAIDFDAGGKIDLGDLVDVSGGDGGTVKLSAGGDVIVRGIAGNGTRDTGKGASVEIDADHGAQLLAAPLNLNGSNNLTAGGDGGMLALHALYGNLAISTDILAQGRGPSGDAGDLELSVQGSITVDAGTTLSVHSDSSSAGTLDLTAGHSLTMAGQMDASGGDAGSISIEVRGAVTISGPMEAMATAVENDGGDITVEAGLQLVVSGTIDVGGGPCDSDLSCGYGGTTTLAGCNVTVTTTGKVLARGPGSGGDIKITAREQLRIDGSISALHVGSLDFADDGSTTLVFPSDALPIIRTNAIQPPEDAVPQPRCSATLEADCLVPCPVCGNGIIEFPEACDDNNSFNCDGCSSFCQLESCGPSGPCSVGCDPVLGCDPTQACTPAPTSSPTVTPTPTGSPGGTDTATATPLPVSTKTETPVAADTPTATATPLPTRLACTGDCDGSGEVTVDEIVTMVNIALGTADISTCLAGDSTSDAEITVDEMVQAVNNALSGCP